MLRLYNTLTRQIEDFKPINPPQVGYYSCGPTVYDFAHIGHARTYVFADILQRVLEFNGFKVKRVMNITDVGHLTSDSDTGEDKMEKGAAREKKSVWDIAKFYTDDFFIMLDKLNIKKPDIVCKATDFIASMIYIIEALEKKGFTYKIADGVYFDTSKFPAYGKLTGQTYNQLQKTLKAGARVELVSGKKHPTDFALWKFSSSPESGEEGLTIPRRQMEWWFKGPFVGKLYKKDDWVALDKLLNDKKITREERNEFRTTIGFPGWHIECSAMSMEFLGKTLDIHTGGVDHIQIHHSNEIAQSEAATGQQFVKYWLHAQHLLVMGEKMSKSLDNFYRMSDIEKKGFDSLALRYLFLTAHYRTQMNFTWKALQASQNALENLYEQISAILEKVEGDRDRYLKSDKSAQADEFQNQFEQTINDDLNTPQAISILWEMLKSDLGVEQKYDLALQFDEVLGLNLKNVKIRRRESVNISDKMKISIIGEIPGEIIQLVEKREKARHEKNFTEADRLRRELMKRGYLVEDLSSGPRLQIK